MKKMKREVSVTGISILFVFLSVGMAQADPYDAILKSQKNVGKIVGNDVLGAREDGKPGMQVVQVPDPVRLIRPETTKPIGPPGRMRLPITPDPMRRIGPPGRMTVPVRPDPARRTDPEPGTDMSLPITPGPARQLDPGRAQLPVTPDPARQMGQGSAQVPNPGRPSPPTEPVEPIVVEHSSSRGIGENEEGQFTTYQESYSYKYSNGAEGSRTMGFENIYDKEGNVTGQRGQLVLNGWLMNEEGTLTYYDNVVIPFSANFREPIDENVLRRAYGLPARPRSDQAPIGPQPPIEVNDELTLPTKGAQVPITPDPARRIDPEQPVDPRREEICCIDPNPVPFYPVDQDQAQLPVRPDPARQVGIEKSHKNDGKEVGNGTLRAREGKPGMYVEHTVKDDTVASKRDVLKKKGVGSLEYPTKPMSMKAQSPSLRLR